jgi:dolichyl-phosphate-mannose-protein mannosyltransferase
MDLKHRIQPFKEFKENEVDEEEFMKNMNELEDESEMSHLIGKQAIKSTMFGFMSQNDLKWLGGLTFLAVIVRLAIINNPGVVVFDEVHFGGFAAKYLRGEFFFDLHPPLARLLVALSGWLSGFKGDFNFHDIGVDYAKHGVPYVGMRVFSGVFGVATIPFAFVTMTALGASQLAAVSVALMVLFENSLVTQSRLILLDSYLIFFTAASLMFWTIFARLDKDKHRQWDLQWWSSLALTGFSLGCAASCKWVGLFTVASVGVQVIYGLWGMWCNTLIPVKSIAKAFGARALCLILLPAAIYISTFWVHFKLLPNHSLSVNSFTLQFQQNFAETRIPATNGPVYYGSTISLRQDRRDNPGYLHSHDTMYPTGSKQQQVTIYHHKDANNLFVIKRPYVVNVTYSDNDLNDPLEEEDFVNLRHGDSVRLMHLLTGRFLHSHNEQAPLSTKKEHHAEVSCYGHDPSHFSDLNDNWLVLIVDKSGKPLPQPPNRQDSPFINALVDRLIFMHPQASCVLHSNNKMLPDWGFKQGEVTCGREVLKGHTFWKIESNEHPLHHEDETNFLVEHRRAGFWEMFAELHGRMWVVNAGLNSPHYFQSWAKDWPFLRRGLGFWNGGQIPRSEAEIMQSSAEKDPKRADGGEGVTEEEKKAYTESYKELTQKTKGTQIYLLGNIITWHSVTLAIFTLLTLVGSAIIIEQRIRFAPGFGFLRQQIQFLKGLIKFEGGVMFCLMSWLLHYFPFYLMGRQLFLHHYLPALYCGIMMLGMTMDKVIPEKAKRGVFIGLTSMAIVAFFAYAPLAYGTTFKLCNALKLKSQWDWDCSK